MNIPNHISLKEYFTLLLGEEKDKAKAKELSNTYSLFEEAVIKMKNLGYEIKPVIKVPSTMSAATPVLDHISLSYTEAIRLLVIADFIQKNKQSPTLIDLAHYKSENPTRDDAANEGRIINLLESKELIEKERSANGKMNQEKLSITEDGKKMIDLIIADARYLRKVYNRSRNQRLRAFILNYIEQLKNGKIITFNLN